MPAKKLVHPLPEHVTSYVNKSGKIAYKYQRRVPAELHGLLIIVGTSRERKVWDYSLGSDFESALERAKTYRDKHDQEIALLSNSETREQVFHTGANVLAAIHANAALERGEAKVPDWRKTHAFLELCATLSAPMEIEALATYAATCFGDSSYVDNMHLSPFAAQLIQLQSPLPPEGGLERTLWDAYKSVVEVRLSELMAVRKADASNTITSQMEKYISTKKRMSESTKRAYRGRVKRLINFLDADPQIDQITPAMLRLFRDHLANGSEENRPIESVRQYFYPLITLFRWAYKEELLSEIPTDKVELPDAAKTVEEAKWQAFNAAEINVVWKTVQQEWGPDSTSRLSPDRRATFLMVFRVLLWTGMRPNEVFKLTPEQVEPDRLQIRKTKTSMARTIPLAKPISDFHFFIQSDVWTKARQSQKGSGTVALEATMSESFTEIIRDAGLINDRHVLYSLKDTMLDRLEDLNASENVQRSIIGHVTGRKSLRNYKTSAKIEQMREYLDMLRYCEGLPY